MALAETVRAVTALRRCSLWGGRTVFRPLHGFAFAVDVGSIVGAFRLWFRLLLLLGWRILWSRLGRWLGALRECGE
jgi:hypothetical protein